MKRWGKALVLMAAVLFTAGITMCNVGMQYEISQIPPEQRAQMTDTDWVGAEWGLRALIVQMVGLVWGVVGAVLLLINRWRSSRVGVSF